MAASDFRCLPSTPMDGNAHRTGIPPDGELSERLAIMPLEREHPERMVRSALGNDPVKSRSAPVAALGLRRIHRGHGGKLRMTGIGEPGKRNQQHERRNHRRYRITRIPVAADGADH